MQTEKDLERECKKYAEAQGYLSLKMTCPGHAGVPDRLFISPRGMVTFVEFKKLDGRLSPIQERMIKIFKAHKKTVEVIRTLDTFKTFVMME
jgi:hypothetical protein